SRPKPPADTARIYTELVAAGRRGDAVEYFMTKVVELPAEFAAQARQSPWWPSQEALAHTLAYDATIMGDYSLPTERAAAVRVPPEVVSALGSSKRPAVRVTINGYTYRSTVAVMGGEFMLPLSAENRSGAGVAAGDEVEVDIELDTAPREVSVPPDFAEALAG